MASTLDDSEIDELLDLAPAETRTPPARDLEELIAVTIYDALGVALYPCDRCHRVIIDNPDRPSEGMCGGCGSPICPSCREREDPDETQCPRCCEPFCADCATGCLARCAGGHPRCAECADEEGSTTPAGICPECDPEGGEPARELAEDRMRNRSRSGP